MNRTRCLKKTPGLYLLGLILSLSALSGCKDSVQPLQAANFDAIPGTFRFSKVTIGYYDKSEVILRNNTEGEVAIRKIHMNIQSKQEFQLDWATDEQEGPFVGYNNDFEDKFIYPIKIKPGKDFKLLLRYVPIEGGVINPSDHILLETNVEDKREFSLPIIISDTGPEIRVNPSSLNFGRVQKNTSEYREVVISNLGEAVVNLRGIDINGSLDFSPLIDNRDVRIETSLLDDPDNDGKPGLAPFNSEDPSAGGQFILRVEYAPPEEGPDRGVLVIRSDDPRTPELQVQLTANGETPCLAVTPRALEFETSLVNRTDSRPLNIESCGGTQLTISDIYIANSSDPAYAVVEGSLPDFPSVLPALTPGELPPSRQIQVAFSPREQHIYNGTLIIESDDPVNPKREVSLLGRGVQNACPRAAAMQDEFYVNPLDPVILDGAASVDPDGPNNVPERYEWVVTARPMGSTSQPIENFIDPLQPQDGGPADDPFTPTAMFFTDLAGTYTIELRVTDNLGAGSAACPSAIAVVTIVAKPDEAIHVQLVWDTPADLDQRDEHGTDLDLHFLHPRANNWFDPGLDCYFRDYSPDWGQQGNPNDNPVLDIDDFNGAGPENVSLAQPEIILDEFDEAVPYSIGVHYNRSAARTTGEEFGSSTAYVRIFLNGEIAWDSQEAGAEWSTLEEEGHFWEAARIFWPGDPEAAYVETRDRYFEEPPGLE